MRCDCIFEAKCTHPDSRKPCARHLVQHVRSWVWTFERIRDKDHWLPPDPDRAGLKILSSNLHDCVLCVRGRGPRRAGARSPFCFEHVSSFSSMKLALLPRNRAGRELV
ncbi:hypothetical protein EVAR_62226_1 [Eumeta japonica]|uniref:Uncharacterized protein n=1 Tax=Eumeta variegata TaxID=151549 RepID=A0A4C1ZDC5_EUMVA|nr:hypothetical protein EVAR_62226_1 [Eumeta japonica]